MSIDRMIKKGKHMLHEFLISHKSELIKNCKTKADLRSESDKSTLGIESGIPVFLDQLVEVLKADLGSIPIGERESAALPKIDKLDVSELSATATQHGREISKHEMSVGNLVHEYGDLCQAITKLAADLEVPIDVKEFRILNRCLDDAIADAVTEYSYQKQTLSVSRVAEVVDERLRVLANEQRHHLRTAQLAMKAIRSGNVGLHGATGAILELSLASLQTLLDRFLNGLGWSAELPARQHLIVLSDFINEVKESYPPEVQAKRCKFSIRDIDGDLAIVADSDLLFMAVGTLLENVLKTALTTSEIVLSARAFGERVLIEIASANCAGALKKSDKSVAPEATSQAVESPVHLDLSMCRRGIEASKGFLRVKDVHGVGEIFTIDLPRHLPR